MWHVLTAIGTTAGLLAFWLVVLFVVPGLIALHVARLFPLTGQWRRRWRERRARRAER